ncbi:MAG TPA: GyrI-like domain-containing protein, partial [Clostridia bacterium]|nr:GyrI-like domain-containing protein [Clostridia bacterium]
MSKRRWLSTVLIFALLLSCFPLGISSAKAATPQQLRQIFDTMDKRTNGGNWYKNNNNESNILSWNQSYVMASYVTMYEATGDTYYLDRFIDHADSVLKTRDSVRGVKDYRGLSTPSWRTGGPNYDLNGQILNGQYYIMGVNTGMISYSFAEFAAIVYNTPALAKYKNKAEIYLQAAKDAVAVHDYEWVDNGSTGYYVFKKGAPYWTDGANLPHNQYLALARTQLAIYQATGDKFYYDRVEKMARLFKNNLTIDQKTGAYIWHYQWGKGLNGWTSSDNLSVNKPSYGGYKRYEDVSHGAIDVDFAYKAYKAGIVFTEEDMIRFGKTVENYLILPNGKVAQFVNGGVEAKYQIMIAHWLRISDYAPSAYPLAEKLITSLTGAGGSGMLAIAMTNLAANGGGGVIIKPQDPVENPPEQPELPVESGEIIINGGFEKNQTGWSGSLVTIKTESNGNKYLTNGYNWQAYQDLNLSAGEYKLTAKTKKLTATTQA